MSGDLRRTNGLRSARVLVNCKYIDGIFIKRVNKFIHRSFWLISTFFNQNETLGPFIFDLTDFPSSISNSPRHSPTSSIHVPKPLVLPIRHSLPHTPLHILLLHIRTHSPTPPIHIHIIQKQDKRHKSAAGLGAQERQLSRTILRGVACSKSLRTDDIADGEGTAHKRSCESALCGAGDVGGCPLRSVC